MNKTKVIRDMMRIYKQNDDGCSYDLEKTRCEILQILSSLYDEENEDNRRKIIDMSWLLGIKITSNEFEPDEYEFDESVTKCMQCYFKFSEVLSTLVQNRTMVLECIWLLAQINDITFDDLIKDFVGAFNER